MRIGKILGKKNIIQLEENFLEREKKNWYKNN